METVKRSHRARFQTGFEAIASLSSAMTRLSTFLTHWFMPSCSIALTSPAHVPHIKWLHSLLWGPGTSGPPNSSRVFREKVTGTGLGNVALFSDAGSRQHPFGLPPAWPEHHDSWPEALPRCLLLKCHLLHFCLCHGVLALDPAFPTVCAPGRNHSEPLPPKLHQQPARGSLGCRTCVFSLFSSSVPFCLALTPLSFCPSLWEASVEESQTN